MKEKIVEKEFKKFLKFIDKNTNYDSKDFDKNQINVMQFCFYGGFMGTLAYMQRRDDVTTEEMQAELKSITTEIMAFFGNE